MIEVQNSRKLLFRIAILIALFFICGFGSLKSTYQPINNDFSVGMASELHSSSLALLDYQKCTTPERTEFSNENFNIKFFSKESNLISASANTSQIISLLRQKHTGIKPLILARFYFYFHITSSEDFPLLS